MIQVTLTETAANKVKELIQRNDPDTGKPLGTPEDTYLRMYVAGGGCSDSGTAWLSTGRSTTAMKSSRSTASRSSSTRTARSTWTDRPSTMRRASRAVASS